MAPLVKITSFNPLLDFWIDPDEVVAVRISPREERLELVMQTKTAGAAVLKAVPVADAGVVMADRDRIAEFINDSVSPSLAVTDALRATADAQKQTMSLLEQCSQLIGMARPV